MNSPAELAIPGLLAIVMFAAIVFQIYLDVRAFFAKRAANRSARQATAR